MMLDPCWTPSEKIRARARITYCIQLQMMYDPLTNWQNLFY